MGAQNFNYLCDLWLKSTDASKALATIEEWKPKELAKLLRHHSEYEDGVWGESVWRRDEVDELLAFYGILEIALMIGFVTDMPKKFCGRHLRILGNPSLRTYYEWNYPLDLPRRLRERLQFDVAYSVAPGTQLEMLFYEFLELSRIIEIDEDVEAFLWTLDSGIWGSGDDSCDISDVRKGLRSPRRLLSALQQTERKKTYLDQALVGFCRFIQFLERFGALLDRAKEWPEVSEAMWLAHAYWLRQFKMGVGDNLTFAISALSKWQVTGKGAKAALARRVKELQEMVERVGESPIHYQGRRKRRAGVQIAADSERNAIKEIEVVEEAYMHADFSEREHLASEVFRSMKGVPSFEVKDMVTLIPLAITVVSKLMAIKAERTPESKSELLEDR